MACQSSVYIQVTHMCYLAAIRFFLYFNYFGSRGPIEAVHCPVLWPNCILWRKVCGSIKLSFGTLCGELARWIIPAMITLWWSPQSTSANALWKRNLVSTEALSMKILTKVRTKIAILFVLRDHRCSLVKILYLFATISESIQQCLELILGTRLQWRESFCSACVRQALMQPVFSKVKSEKNKVNIGSALFNEHCS